MGSDGRIEFDVADQDEPRYLSDLVSEPAEPAVFTEPVDPAARADPAPQTAPESPAPPAPAQPPVVDAEPTTPPPASPTRAARAGRRIRRRLPLSTQLAVHGGADADVLEAVPEETSRFVQMFFVLAGTALVSALSMLFALTTGVRVAVWLAVPLALVWALIIFNLDRFLTSTMRSTRNVWKLVGLAIPRVFLAALIGVVVAEPLVLQAFQNDIAREINATNVVQAQADQDAVTNGPEKQALDAAAARVATLEDQAATGIVEGTSSTSAETVAAQQTVDQLTAQLAEQQAVIDQARAVYQCELTGEGVGTVPGCTGVTGEGASSQAAQAQLTQAQAGYDALAIQLQDATAELTAANAAGTDAAASSAAQNKQLAADQLPGARAQYESALAAYDARAAQVADGNAEAMGLLSQMSAMERLAEREPALALAHWLIALLFFMIELLPVLVKVLTSYGDPSLYERADAMKRQVALDRVTASTWRERAAIVRA